jgi:hypothetical protein
MSVELENIDCNCNECKHLERDFAEFKKWEQWNREIQLKVFEAAKEKAIADAERNIQEALTPEDKRSCEGLLRKALKMKFQFNRDTLISYGRCIRFDKKVSFIPGVCQLETQHCFEHRKATSTSDGNQNY